MKKLIIFTLALSLMLASVALASQTRVWTMGDNNRILVDDANIWMFPSRLNDYPGLAVGEFESSDNFTRFGVHWQFGDDDPWVLATYFDNNSNYQPWFAFPNFLTVPSQNTRIHALYARNMGTNKFGARVSAYHSSSKSEVAGVTSSDQSFSYYDLVLGLTEANNAWDVTVNAGFGTWTDKVAGDSIQSEPDGLIDFMVMGRMFWNSGPNYQYVPHASVEFHKQGENYFDGNAGPATTELQETDKYTEFIIDIGIGQVYTPSNNVEAVLDVGLALDNFKLEHDSVGPNTTVASFENKATWTVIPYFKLGLDAEVFNWLDVRFGATSYWTRYKAEQTSGSAINEQWQNYANNETYLGLGFHWGNLHVDTYTDPEIFLDGFTFISGGLNSNMNFNISATYDLM